jgi:hypothetical protein
MANPNLLRTVPKWLKDASQGLAYWIGYSGVRDPTSAPELALGHELARLIGAKAKGLEVRTETYYRTIQKFQSKAITQAARVDVTLWKNVEPGRIKPALALRHVIEIKRAKAGARKIEADLRRLAAVVEELHDVRAFLILVSEGELPPKPYASEKGLRYKLRAHDIEGTQSQFIVTGVFKAAAAFQLPDQAHYVCIAEVAQRPGFDPHENHSET